MTKQFNLIDEKWIQALNFKHEISYYSLRDIFKEASNIKEIFEQVPIITASIYRLLLAIVHRAIDGPKDENEWLDIWNDENNGRVNYLNKINDYLTKWHERFYLFHDKFPFYQVGDLTEEDKTSIAKLNPAFTSGNNPTLFDHSLDNEPPELNLSEAAKWLISMQSFSLGGLVSNYKSERGSIKNRASKAANLAKAAMVLLTGENLFETLHLNTIMYNRDEDYPFEFNKTNNVNDDKPAWEQDDPVEPKERIPIGLVDWLTWQSRSIKLFKNNHDKVNEVVFANGYYLPKSLHRKNYETMLAFKKSNNKSEPFPAVSFNLSRLIWRDSNALFGTLENEVFPPKTIDWIAEISDYLEDSNFPIKLYGAISDQASYKTWKEESLPFNAKWLNNQDFIKILNGILEFSEKGGIALWIALKTFIAEITPDLAQKLKQNNGRFEKNDNERINKMIDSLNLQENYWKKVSKKFRQQLIELQTNNLTIDTFDFDKWNKFIEEECGLAVLEEYFKSCYFNSNFLKAYTHAVNLYKWKLKQNGEN